MDHFGGLRDFETWAPLLEYLREEEKLGGRDSKPGGLLEGEIGQHGWSIPRFRHRQNPGRAAVETQRAAIRREADALTEAGGSSVSFSARTAPVMPAGDDQAARSRVALRVRVFSPAEQQYPGLNYEFFPRVVSLVDVPVLEPWRREPDPVPGARPAPTADPGLVKRTMRERLPGATGATDEEIAACERRLGVSCSSWTACTSLTHPPAISAAGTTRRSRRSSLLPGPGCRAWSGHRAGSCSPMTAAVR